MLFPVCLLVGYNPHLPPCRLWNHSSKHHYCFYVNEVQCYLYAASLPSSYCPEIYTFPASLSWITSLQKYLSISEFSLPISLAAWSVAHGLKLLLTSPPCSLSPRLLNVYLPSLLLLGLPLFQSLSLISPILCLPFFFSLPLLSLPSIWVFMPTTLWWPVAMVLNLPWFLVG